ncbi:MAG TPA: glycosyltransferase family 39 protein [Patescibacteria group bacterium]
MKNFIEKNYKSIIFIILAFMFVVSVLNAKNDSAIFDEVAHIPAGYSYLTQHEIRLNPEHPPLIKDLAGLPLLFMHLNFNVTDQPFWTGTLPGKWDEGQWAAGRYLLYGAGNNPDNIIFWARVPIILLSLIFGLFIFKWAREMAGLYAGLIALVLYAFDPNILGHNHFVTTDLGIAAFFTFSFYFYLKFIKNPTWKNVFLAGIFLGLLFLAKFSFLVALPVFGLAAIIYPLVIHAPATDKNSFFRLRKLGEYLGKGAIIFVLSLIVVWGLYAANTYRMTKETVAQSIENNFPAAETSNIKAVYTNKVLHWLNNRAITRPYTEFGIGVAYVFRRVSGGNGAYFMGQVSGTAFRAYFPTVFLMKESLPALFLMLFALIYALSRFARTFFQSFNNFFRKNLENIGHYLRTSIVEISLFLFVVLYSYISITGNLNIGFRHLFPILPFIYILTAKNISGLMKKLKSKNNSFIFSTAILLLLAYLIVETVAAYPSYTSYFNQAAGGPKYGYHYATDSNADWGQDLKRLKLFLADHPEISKIRVDYFGGGDIKYYIGDKYLMWWDSKRPVEAGWYAVSTNFLMGSIYEKTKKDTDSYRWLANKKPAYQVGTSILIYNITTEDLKSIK